MWTGLVWLGIRTGGELLWIRYWTFGFHEMLGNYLVASRVVFSSIELVWIVEFIWEWAVGILKGNGQERRDVVLRNMCYTYVGASLDFCLVILVCVAYIGWLIIWEVFCWAEMPVFKGNRSQSENVPCRWNFGIHCVVISLKHLLLRIIRFWSTGSGLLGNEKSDQLLLISFLPDAVTYCNFLTRQLIRWKVKFRA
jgi:hypothetical protein